MSLDRRAVVTNSGPVKHNTDCPTYRSAPTPPSPSATPPHPITALVGSASKSWVRPQDAHQHARGHRPADSVRSLAQRVKSPRSASVKDG
jgi:hypothetical protein